MSPESEFLKRFGDHLKDIHEKGYYIKLELLGTYATCFDDWDKKHTKFIKTIRSFARNNDTSILITILRGTDE
jgi:hypothetical protein